MLKYLLFISTIIGFSFTAKAQKKLVEYGFHGGVNLNSSHGSSLLNKKTSMSVGYNLGSHIKIGISHHFGIKALLEYEQNGWVYRSLTFENYTGTGLTIGDVRYKLNYLNLPILGEYEFGNKIKFNANAGLFFGVLLKDQLIPYIQDHPRSKSSANNWKSFNYGISTGMGTQIPITTKMKLNFNLRYNLGPANLNKSQGSSKGAQKTNSISISSGLTFRL